MVKNNTETLYTKTKVHLRHLATYQMWTKQ